MDAKFTKGPWRIRAERYRFIRVESASGGIAGLDTIDGEGFANARLIAAAPELYEAARLVMAWHEAEEDHSKEPDFYKRVEMCRESERAIRAALAKANGDQP